MADTPQQAPAPSTPASATSATAGGGGAGFKLKLKFGGGHSSSASTSSLPTATTSTGSPSTATVGTSNDAIATNQQQQQVGSVKFSTSRLPGSLEPSASTSQSAIDSSQSPMPDVSMAEEDEDEDEDEIDDELADDDRMDDGDYGVKRKTSVAKKRKTGSLTPGGGGAAGVPNAFNDGAAVTANQASSSSHTGIHPSSTAMQPLQSAAPSEGAAIGSMLIPAAPAPTTKKKPKSAVPPGPGTGRAWRRGLKGYAKPDASAVASGAGGSTIGGGGGGGAGEYSSPGASAAKRRRPNVTDDAGGDDVEEGAEDFVPNMVVPGGLATSEKWANGLPGGNEQSRATAAMASAVNKIFPVGQPPKTGSGFLVAQPLDKSTPKPRKWQKVKREIVGPYGVPFFVTVWEGDENSPYATHMLAHPRPPPPEKKPSAAAALGSLGEFGSPHPESYAASEAGGSVADEGEGVPKPKPRRRPPGPAKSRKKTQLPPPPPGQPIVPIAATSSPAPQ